MRSQVEVQRALKLGRDGFNASEIARMTGVPRSTISQWLIGRTPKPGGRAGGCPRCSGFDEIAPGITGFAYAYLLGMYLGDGCLLQHPRGVMRLSIALDSAYPGIIAECSS